MTICFLNNNSNKGTPLDSLPSLRKGIFIFCSASVPFRKHPVPQALSGFSLQCHYCNFEVNCSFAFLIVLPQMYVSLNESLFSHLFLNFLVIEKNYAVYILQLAAFCIQHCFSFFFLFFLMATIYSGIAVCQALLHLILYMTLRYRLSLCSYYR